MVKGDIGLVVIPCRKNQVTVFKDGVKDCVIDLDQSAASVKGGMTGEDTLRVSFTRIV